MSMRAATTPPRQLPEPAAPEASEQVAKRVELAELAVRKSRYCFDKDDDDLWEQARVQYKCENGPQSRDCFDEDDLQERVPCKNGPALALRQSRYCFDEDDLREQARVQYKCENGPQSRDCCFDEDDLHERVPYKCKNGPALPPLSDCTYLTTATTSSTSSSSTSSTS